MEMKKKIEEKKKRVEDLRNNFQALERQKQSIAQEILKLQGSIETLEEIENDNKKD